jgi:DNA repair protein RecN (Recombination protein N)
MLRRLHLKDFVIVDQLDLELAPGFTVLTGETGAGKSILIDAIGLLLGARGDASMIREGKTKADLSAAFDLTPLVKSWLLERELLSDESDENDSLDAEVLLRRVLDTEGRSKAFINGTPCTLQMLKDLGAILLDIHGQHASLWLTKAALQRQLLDDIGQHQTLLATTREHFTGWQQFEKRLENARKGASDIEEKRERLAWVLDELNRLRPQPGEWQQLNSDHKRLANAAALLQGAQTTIEALDERDNSLVGELEQLTSRLRAQVNNEPQFEPIIGLLDQANIALSEATHELKAYLEKTDLDSQRLQVVDDRMADIYSSARKFKVPAEELPAWYEGKLDEFKALADNQDIAGLTAKAQQAQAAFESSAALLSKARIKAAKSMAKNATTHLQGLGMANSTLQISVTPGAPSAFGVDEVEFQICAHAKVAPKPLGKIASGGELSRVSLALAVVAAVANPVPCLIFDEADAGVGGAVAEMIGQLMRKLGADRQVLCVTHLPQVAALAHNHWQVSKQHSQDSVLSRMTLLDKAKRVDEIARMLGGVEITATTRRHAGELLRQSSD